MFDMEKFIRAVQTKPDIWMTGEKPPGYRYNKKIAWEEVAQEMTVGWNTFTQGQQDAVVSKLQKKWRHLRDYHLKCSKQNKARTRKAEHLNLLTFLDFNIDTTVRTTSFPHKRRRSDAEYFNCIDSEDSDKNASNTSQGLEPTYEERELTFEIPIENVQDSEDFQTSRLNVVQNMKEDPDRSFLVSIFPDIKSMSERQKVKFKLEAMQLIDKLKYSKQRANADEGREEEDCIELADVCPNIKIEIDDDFARHRSD